MEEPKRLPLANNLFIADETKPPVYPIDVPLTADYISSPRQSSDIFQGKLPNKYSSSSSSPTALSLLLRSSVFRDLVEKNSNVEEDDENVKNTTAMVGGEDDEDYAEIFCDMPYQLEEREMQFIF